MPDTNNKSTTGATQEQNNWDTIDTNAAWVRHDCNTILTRATRVQHEQQYCYTKDTIVTGVTKFDFDNVTSENIFSNPYITCMVTERLSGEEQFPSKNYLLKMRCSHAKIRLKSASRKLEFVIAKALSKRFTLDCSYKCSSTFLHSYA